MRSATRCVSALSLVAAMLLDGCYQYRTIRGDELGRPQESLPAVVRVTLRDSTRATFESPSLYERGIDGTVSECDGPSCVMLISDRHVRFSSVAQIEARERGAGRVVGITLGTLLLLGLVGSLVALAAGGVELGSGSWRFP